MNNQDKYTITYFNGELNLIKYKIPLQNANILLEKEFYINEKILDSLYWFEVILQYDYQELVDKKSLNEKYNELKKLIKAGDIRHFYKKLDTKLNKIKIFKKSKFIKQKQGYIKITYPNYNEGIKPFVEYLEGYLKVLNKLFLILNLKKHILLYKYNYIITVDNKKVKYTIVSLYKRSYKSYKIVLNEEFYQKNKILGDGALHFLLIIEKDIKNIVINKKMKNKDIVIPLEFNKKEHSIKEIIEKLKAIFIELESKKYVIKIIYIWNYVKLIK